MVMRAKQPIQIVRTDRPGIALLLVVLVTMVVGAIAAAGALIGLNGFLIGEYDQRTSLLESVADAGLELGRARLNAEPSLYSDTMVVALEVDAAVYDVDGAAIPGVTRTVQVLPVGGGAGEYGNYAALVSIATDESGTLLIRRMDLLRESFARFAYLTDYEPPSYGFGAGDQLFGPVHSNSSIKTWSSRATFHGPVTTAGEFVDPEYATFHADTSSGVRPILMPTASQLARLEDRASPAHLSFSEPSGTVSGAQATLRIEFVSRDTDSDGVAEGFIRVYRSSNGAWVTADVPGGYGSTAEAIGSSDNCGYLDADGLFTQETVAQPGKNQGQGKGQGKGNKGGNGKGKGLGHHAAGVVANACFLGGSEILTTDGAFDPTDEGRGQWLAYPGGTPASVAGQPDAGYLFPIDRTLNQGFRGVIFVGGSVVVSGTVRSRVTLAATGDIIIGDDLVYETDPGAASCTDILGLFAGGDVIVADNTINSPQQSDASTSTWNQLDETADEFIHGTILALDQFSVEHFGSGAEQASICGTDTNGNPIYWGRGCLRVTGGIIQDTRGGVGTVGGTGYLKQYTHDTCGLTAPPPYFPSTGRFIRGRYYEVEPVGFDLAQYFEALN